MSSRATAGGRLAHHTLLGLSVFQIGLVTFLVLNQLRFPLHLDVMEGAVLMHFQRAASFEPVYPDASPQYLPLAYNVLYYYLSVPFGWLFGVNLVTLRIVSLLGMVGSAVVILRMVGDKTKSVWWSVVAVGLFAAAYRAQDAYLNTAHSDSWLLFCALLGSYIIHRNKSRAWNVLGVVALVAAFWFKQHGALFAFGGVLYLTWCEGRDSDWKSGLKRSIPYWIVAVMLGPALYVLAGPPILGAQFHYFTWEVPRSWMDLGRYTPVRPTIFAMKYYFVLAVTGSILVIHTTMRSRSNLNVWHVQFVFACLTAIIGALDPGSADNVFIPMGTWCVLMGTVGLHELNVRSPLARQSQVHLIALFIAFSQLLYYPAPFVISATADEAYADFIGFLEGLEGEVYGPWQAQLNGEFDLYPTPHWVALDDMIRGPGVDVADHPNTRRLLEPVLYPASRAFVVSNKPLETWSLLTFLKESYVLEADLGNRFAALTTLPKRFNHGYPRYLYRYDPELAQAVQQDLDPGR